MDGLTLVKFCNVGPLINLPYNIAMVEGKGARCSVVVKALCYKPEGRGFDTR
jgi:hypothetical protein